MACFVIDVKEAFLYPLVFEREFFIFCNYFTFHKYFLVSNGSFFIVCGSWFMNSCQNLSEDTRVHFLLFSKLSHFPLGSFSGPRCFSMSDGSSHSRGGL